jgi:hypothetical protein
MPNGRQPRPCLPHTIHIFLLLMKTCSSEAFHNVFSVNFFPHTTEAGSAEGI